MRRDDPGFLEMKRRVAAENSRRGAHKNRVALPRKGDPTYGTWRSMRRRCSSPRATDYANYGGRGITVCDRWQSFEAFLEDMGPRPAGTTLDRADNSGPYSPENCRWATRREQAANSRRAIKMTLGEETLCLAEWAERAACSRRTFYNRVIDWGWPLGRALSSPPGRRGPARGAS